MASAWKVAYADFMTAMMAFFLLMWLLNMAPKETLNGLAGMFTADANFQTNNMSSLGVSNNVLIQNVQKLTTEELSLNEDERSKLAIMKAINQFLLAESLPSASSGITSDGVGVLLHITPDLLFKQGTMDLTPEGELVLDEVVKVLRKYNSFLIVRGHADQSETGAPNFPSKWELSAARANAAIRHLVSKGVDPQTMRSVAYADTRPKVPPTVPDAARQNGRVEFNFHRPEVGTSVGY